MSDNERNIPINISYHQTNDERYRKLEEINSTPKYKEYRLKWTENPKNLIIGDAPIHLDIEATSACNLRCSMCQRTVAVEDKSFGFKVGSMDLYLYKKIIDEASEVGVYSIKLMYSGESLLHKNIIDMIKYAKEKDITDVMLTTNATLLDEKMAIDIINSGLDKLAFSFDSPDEKTYESIRVGANYKQTLENIKRFGRLRDELGKTKPLTRITMVMMENNSDAYDKFVELFKDSVDAVSYLNYIEYHSERIDYSVLDKDAVKNYLCSQPWQRLVINWDGKYGACCSDYKFSTNLGNAKELSLKDVWHGDKLNAFRKMHQDGKWKDYEMCRECQAALLMSIKDISDGTV